LEQVLSTIGSILLALLLLSVLVSVHELGHFLVARFLKFRVLEFAIGMGPKIWGKEKNGILYSLRALPIGGMCRFYGEDEGVEDADSFNAKEPWKRILVVIAGPLMNLLLSVILACGLLSAYGDIVAQVMEVPEQTSPAYAAGIQPGDQLYAIDGKKISLATMAVDMIRGVETPDTTVTVVRDGKKLDLYLEDIYNPEMGHNMIGVNILYARKDYTFFEAAGESFSYIGGLISETFRGLGRMVTQGVQPGDVTGPVGVVAAISTAVRYGFETILRLGLILTMSLGIMNLLPIPALDGGRLVFLVIEWIRGKAISPEKEGMIHMIGFALLMVLVIVVTYNDITMLVGG